MTDAEIAEALNALSAATRRAVPLASLLAAAALNGAYAAVKATAESVGRGYVTIEGHVSTQYLTVEDRPL